MFIDADNIMAYLWIIAYLLALLCSLKEKAITIPPISSVFILSWEILGMFRITDFNDVAFDRIGFFVSHFTLFCVQLFYLKLYSKKLRVFYVSLLVIMLCILCYIFTLKNGMYYTSFINTAIGLFFIILFTMLKKDYPLTTTCFYFALLALIGDTIALFKYNHFTSSWLIEIFMVSLIFLHIIHVLVLYSKFKKDGIKVLHSIKSDLSSIKADFVSVYYELFPSSQHSSQTLQHRKYKKKVKRKSHKKNK